MRRLKRARLAIRLVLVSVMVVVLWYMVTPSLLVVGIIIVALIYWPKPRKATEASELTLPRISVSEETKTAASYCPTCKRTSNHVHYSSLHVWGVTCGVLLVLVGEGMAFISGFVKGSTLLYLDYDTISAYEAVARTVGELTAPFENLTNVATVLDIALIAAVVIIGATLHSFSKMSLHRAGALIAPVLLAGEMTTSYYHSSLVDEALLKLPSKVSPYTLQIAAQAQTKFDVAYGFWGAPADLARGALTVAALGALVICAFTYGRIDSVWKREGPIMTPQETVRPAFAPETETQPSIIITPPPTSITHSQNELEKPTKYCRYCGARILRDSKFCEECGKNLA